MMQAALAQDNARPTITAEGCERDFIILCRSAVFACSSVVLRLPVRRALVVPFNQFRGIFCLAYPEEIRNFMDEKEYGETIAQVC